jgi:hypothetical protein
MSERHYRASSHYERPNGWILRHREDKAMTFEIVMGIMLTALALSAVAFLTWWSRRVIERIHAGSSSSLREIKKEIGNG